MAKLAPIHPGDIVEVDIKGRLFFAKAKGRVAAPGGGQWLGIEPVDCRITYTTAKASEVVAQYRKTKNVRTA